VAYHHPQNLLERKLLQMQEIVLEKFLMEEGNLESGLLKVCLMAVGDQETCKMYTQEIGGRLEKQASLEAQGPQSKARWASVKWIAMQIPAVLAPTSFQFTSQERFVTIFE